MLLFLWRRHSISKAAGNDICRILNTFNILNMPKDFRGVIAHVKKNNPTLLHGTHSFICPSCSQKSSNSSQCGFSGCQSASSYRRTPTIGFHLLSCTPNHFDPRTRRSCIFFVSNRTLWMMY